MIKALFFDIDGTLVSFTTHRIPESTLSAIRQAKQRGVKVFISTGRPRAIINNLRALEDEQLIDGYITMNGAYCFAGEQLISASPIPAEDVRHLIQLCEELKFPTIFVDEHQLKACYPDEQVRMIFEEHLNVPAEILPEVPTSAISTEGIYQITPFLTAEMEVEYGHLYPHCESNRWYPAFTDLTKKGTTKQQGVDAICAHFGIQLSETMSFGDGGNDVSMLRYTAIGVAMGNATPEVQQYANYVTAHIDDDGVQKALQHFGVID